ncbi:ThiJ/PfpI family protein [Lachnospiraceae bacterium TWA4]|nr:ThiJ/PfpI family protein [Lachnospiraceae bacterium TWA4]
MIKTAILLADGFEEIEALTVVDVLRRAGIICDMTSIVEDKEVRGAHDIKVVADKNLDAIDDSYQMVILPGGMPGATNLRDNEKVIELVQKFDRDENKFVAAICAAPIVLAKAGISTGRYVTSYPGFEEEFKDAHYEEDLVVVDGHLITARGPATALAFAYAIVNSLGVDSQGLKDSMLYEMLLAQCR